MALDADPYRILGLSRGASLDEVKRAYRRLAKANHPDAAGPGALPRFLAIQAAYELLAGDSGASAPGGRGASTARRRPSASDPDRTGATRRAYGGRPRESRPGPGPTGGTRPNASDPRASERASGPRDTGPAGRRAGATGAERGKATLGSTSYDGADDGPFEPDWGGAGWYGTTSGTYWTINPKEYADPRKHGPEYQARARRTAAAQGAGGPHRGGDPSSGPASDPTHATSSWWDSTSGPATSESEPRPSTEPGPGRAQPAMKRGPGSGEAESFRTDEPAPDPARAAVDLGRALTDARSGGLRGRVLRAVLGWLPIALGLGWLVSELTGCGRFTATCDPSVAPLTVAGQGIVLAALLLLPELAALAAGAALVLLAAAVAASLILSATGAAADEGSRRAALGAVLLVAWLSGLAIAVVRRIRSGPRTARPVS